MHVTHGKDAVMIDGWTYTSRARTAEEASVLSLQLIRFGVAEILSELFDIGASHG